MLEKKYTKKQIEELKKYFLSFFEIIQKWVKQEYEVEAEQIRSQSPANSLLEFVERNTKITKDSLYKDLKNLKKSTRFYQFHEKFLPSILDYDKISRLSDQEQDAIINNAQKRIINRYYLLLDKNTSDTEIRQILKDLFLVDGERPDNRYKNYAKNFNVEDIIKQINETREILKTNSCVNFSDLENYFKKSGYDLSNHFFERTLLNFLLQRETFSKGITPTPEEFNDLIKFIKKEQDRLENKESNGGFNLFTSEKLWFKQKTKPEIRIKIEKKQQELEAKINELKKQQEEENENSTSWFSRDWITGSSKKDNSESLKENIQKFQKELKTLQETQKLLEYQQYCLEGYIKTGKIFLNRMKNIPEIKDPSKLEELNNLLKSIEDLKSSQQNSFEILNIEKDIEQTIIKVCNAFAKATELDMPSEDQKQLELLNDTLTIEKILIEISITEKAALPIYIEDYAVFSNFRNQFYISQIQYVWEQQLKFSKLRLISRLEVLNQNDKMSKTEKDELANQYLKAANLEIKMVSEFSLSECTDEMIKRLNEENKRIKENYHDSNFLSDMLKKDFPQVNRKVLFQLCEKYSKLEQTDNLAKEIYNLLNDNQKNDNITGNFTSEEEIEDMFYWNLFNSSDDTAKEIFFNYAKKVLQKSITKKSEGIKEDFVGDFNMEDFPEYLNFYWNYFNKSKHTLFYDDTSNFFNLSHTKQLQEQENWAIGIKENKSINRVRIIEGSEEEVIISKLEAMYKDDSVAKNYTEEIRKRAKNIHEIWKNFNNVNQNKSTTEEKAKRVAWIKKFVELPHKKQPINRSTIDSNFELLKEEFPWMEKAIDRIKKDILMAEDAKEGEKITTKVICLDGEPGIGKTAFASRVAAALGVPFGKISVAGEKDEKPVKGTAYSYVSSTESKIAQELINAGVTNPVILLDELEKSEGEAFEHTLLPLLNKPDSVSVEDKFFEVGLDYSNVYFIATTNNFHDIRTDALKGRIEVFEIPSPTYEQKLNLFKKEFIKNINKYGEGLDTYNFFEISDEIMEKIFNYADSLSESEEGLRSLLNNNERIAHSFFQFIQHKNEKIPIKVTDKNLKQIIPDYQSTSINSRLVNSTSSNPQLVKSTSDDSNTLADEFKFEGIEFLQVNKNDVNDYSSLYYPTHAVPKAAATEKFERSVKNKLLLKSWFKRNKSIIPGNLLGKNQNPTLKNRIDNIQLDSRFDDDVKERDKFLESRLKTFQGRNHLKLNFSQRVTEYVSLYKNGIPTLFPGKNKKRVNPINPNYDPVNTLYNLEWREQKVKTLVKELKIRLAQIVVAHQKLKTLSDTHDKAGNKKEIELNAFAEHIFGLYPDLQQAFSHNENSSKGESKTTTESENYTPAYEITTNGNSFSPSSAGGNHPLISSMPSSNSSTSYHPSITTTASSSAVTSSTNSGSSNQVLIDNEKLEKIILDALENEKQLIERGGDKKHKDALKNYELMDKEYQKKFGKQYSDKERIEFEDLEIDIPWEQYFRWIEDEWEIIKENMEKYETLSPILFEDIQKNVLNLMNGFVKNDNLTQYWKVKLQYLACDMYETLEKEYSRNPSLFKAMPNNLINEYKKKYNKINREVDLEQDESKNMLEYYNIIETCKKLMQTTDLEFYTTDQFLKRLYELEDLEISDLDENSKREYDNELNKLKHLIKKGADLINQKIISPKNNSINQKVLNKLNEIIDQCHKQKKDIQNRFNRRILLPLFLTKKDNFFRIYHLPQSNKNESWNCNPFNSSKKGDRFQNIRDLTKNITNNDFSIKNQDLLSYIKLSRLRRSNSISLEDGDSTIMKIDGKSSQELGHHDRNFQGVNAHEIFNGKSSIEETKAIFRDPNGKLPIYTLGQKSLLEQGNRNDDPMNVFLNRDEKQSAGINDAFDSPASRKGINQQEWNNIQDQATPSLSSWNSDLSSNDSRNNLRPPSYDFSESSSSLSLN